MDETTIANKAAPPAPLADPWVPPQPDDEEGLVQKEGRRLLGKSWHTAVTGAIVIVLSLGLIIWKLVHHELTVEAAMPMVIMLIGGGGHVLAKDSDVTGGRRTQ